MSDNIFKLVTGTDEFKFWSSIEITRSIDTFDTFSFGAPFDEDSFLRKTIKPLQFNDGQILIDDELLSTIILVNPTPTLTSDDNSIIVTGYSKPGVMNDCSVKFSNYPLEFDGQTLKQIATTLAGFYDVDVEFSESSGATFEKAKLEVGESPFDFLIKLAKLRGFLISNTTDGKMLFWKAASNPRTTILRQGSTPLLSVTPNINSQGYYSEITGLSPAEFGKDTESVTVNNPRTSTNRPLVYRTKQQLSGADLQNAVKWKMGLMFANAIKYSITVQGIRDQNGLIWEPNTYINLTAPGAYVNNETTFLIKSLSISKSDSETTTMNLVLPESYSGQIPERLPWD